MIKLPNERDKRLKVLSKVSLIIFLYIIISSIYSGIHGGITESDSIFYHIPIAKSVLNGTFLNPAGFHANNPWLKYSPGSSETILSLFLLFNVPIYLFNVLAIVILFFLVRHLGILLNLNYELSTVLAVSISSVHGIVRWANTQVIDIWLAVFFVMSLILLERPKNNIFYFVKLGFALGMLIGTKYTGPLFLCVLMLFYFRKLIRYVNFYRLIFLLIPFTLFGLFWYIRNYIVIQNPFYPQETFMFKGANYHILSVAVWNIVFLYPTGFIRTLNAFMGEYMIWSLSLFLSPVYLIIKLVQNKSNSKIIRLTGIGILNCIIYLFLPSALQDNIMVSVFRYSYPALIPLIIIVFIAAKELGKTELITLIAVINLVILPEFSYHPKLLIFLFPLALFTYYNKYCLVRLQRIKQFINTIQK